MSLTSPLDHADVKARLHRFALETATSAMVTDQMTTLARRAGHTARCGAAHLTVTAGGREELLHPPHDPEVITAEVESVYDGEALTVLVLIRRADTEYTAVERVITVNAGYFNRQWEAEFTAALTELLGQAPQS